MYSPMASHVDKGSDNDKSRVVKWSLVIGSGSHISRGLEVCKRGRVEAALHGRYNLSTQRSEPAMFLQAELALQLCWAVGEYGGGGSTNKDAARQLFESLELVLYENLASRYAFFLTTLQRFEDREDMMSLLCDGWCLI